MVFIKEFFLENQYWTIYIYNSALREFEFVRKQLTLLGTGYCFIT